MLAACGERPSAVRDFGVRKLLEVPHHDDLLVLRFERAARLFEASFQFAPGGGRGRRQLAGRTIASAMLRVD